MTKLGTKLRWPFNHIISFKYHTFFPMWELHLCYIKCRLATKIPSIQSLSISLNSWDQSESQSRSQLLRPKWKVLVSVSIFETMVKSLSLSLNSWYQQSKVSVPVSASDTHTQKSQSQSEIVVSHTPDCLDNLELISFLTFWPEQILVHWYTPVYLCYSLTQCT